MEKELIKITLDAAHPISKGWQHLRACSLDNIDIDMVYVKRGKKPVAVVILDGAFVCKDDLKMAEHLRHVYNEKMNGREVRVLLVYQELLARPQAVPKGVSILSISDGSNDRNPTIPFTAMN